MLSGASYPVWGRRASKELLALRQEVLERSATASLVEADSNTQHGGASNEEGTTPSCVDSSLCVQGGAGASVDAWECVFSGWQSWAPCRSFCPMAQVVCTKGDATPNSKLRPSSVERSLYVLSAVSMEQNEQRRALSGLPIVCDSNKPGNGFGKRNKAATLHLKFCRNLSNQPGPPLRADYGKAVIEDLSRRLTRRYGKGYSTVSLWNMRKFYQTYIDRAVTILSPMGSEFGHGLEKRYPAGGESEDGCPQPVRHTLRGQSPH